MSLSIMRAFACGALHLPLDQASFCMVPYIYLSIRRAFAWCPTFTSRSGELLHGALHLPLDMASFCMVPYIYFSIRRAFAWCPTFTSRSAPGAVISVKASKKMVSLTTSASMRRQAARRRARRNSTNVSTFPAANQRANKINCSKFEQLI